MATRGRVPEAKVVKGVEQPRAPPEIAVVLL